MAEQTITLKLIWENRNHFTMKEIKDGVTKNVISAEENGCMADIWGELAVACSKYFVTILASVGKDMKKV